MKGLWEQKGSIRGNLSEKGTVSDRERDSWNFWIYPERSACGEFDSHGSEIMNEVRKAGDESDNY